MGRKEVVLVWFMVVLVGFILLMVLIFGIFDKQKRELIAKHQQKIETIEVLEKRIELIEEQLEFTYWLLPDGEKNENTSN